MATNEEESIEEQDWGDDVRYVCRAGEVEDLKELLKAENWPENGAMMAEQSLPYLLNTFALDENKTSPLHMASANGHVECVRILLANGAKQLLNSSNNSPLHWALLNRQKKVIELLLSQQDEGIDVLKPNSNGKSINTLAFDFGDEAIVKLVLEHSSAAPLEAKRQGEEEEETEEENGGEAKSDHPTHAQSKQYLTLRFGNLALGERQETTVSIRQVGQRPTTLEELADEAGLQNTGNTVWGASVILARWILDPSNSAVLKDASVLELGAGCGLPGIATWWCTDKEHLPKRVMLTDGEGDLDNLEHNAKVAMKRSKKKANRPTTLEIATLDWTDADTYHWVGETDVVLGADLVYDPQLVTPLVNVITALLKPGGVFFYCTANTARAGMDLFVMEMRKDFVLRTKEQAPEKYLQNPLVDCTEDQFELFFGGELTVGNHLLFKFVKKQ